MKTIDKQLKDWREIKELCLVASVNYGPIRTRTVQELYLRVKVYYHTYKTKFDMHNPPKEG